MATTKTTRAQLFARIAETMNDDFEVVEMCNKYIEQLNKPRTRKPNQKAIDFAEKLYNIMVEQDAELTCGEWVEVLAEQDVEASPQKVSNALTRLRGEGLVERLDGEKVSDKPMFTAIAQQSNSGRMGRDIVPYLFPHFLFSCYSWLDGDST